MSYCGDLIDDELPGRYHFWDTDFSEDPLFGFVIDDDDDDASDVDFDFDLDGGFCGGLTPASKDAVASMPTIKIAVDTDSHCAICQDAFEVGAEARQMPCSHFYHHDCILPWLESHNSCPVCRHEMPKDLGEREDGLFPNFEFARWTPPPLGLFFAAFEEQSSLDRAILDFGRRLGLADQIVSDDDGDDDRVVHRRLPFCASIWDEVDEFRAPFWAMRLPLLEFNWMKLDVGLLDIGGGGIIRGGAVGARGGEVDGIGFEIWRSIRASAWEVPLVFNCMEISRGFDMVGRGGKIGTLGGTYLGKGGKFAARHHPIFTRPSGWVDICIPRHCPDRAETMKRGIEAPGGLERNGVGESSSSCKTGVWKALASRLEYAGITGGIWRTCC